MRTVTIIFLLLFQTSCAQDSDPVETILLGCFEQKLQEKDQNFKEKLSNFEQQMIEQGVLESASGTGYYDFYNTIAKTNQFPDPVLSGKLDSLFSHNPKSLYSKECLQKFETPNQTEIEKSTFYRLMSAIINLSVNLNISPSTLATEITSHLRPQDLDKPLYRYLTLYVVYGFGTLDEGILRSLPPPKEDQEEDKYEQFHVHLLAGDKLIVDDQPISENDLKKVHIETS